MYNIEKEVIFIKRKNITFIFSFILFILIGVGVFLFVEENTVQASALFGIAFILFILIIVFSFKKTKLNNNDIISNDLKLKDSNEAKYLSQDSIKLVKKDLEPIDNEFNELTLVNLPLKVLNGETLNRSDLKVESAYLNEPLIENVMTDYITLKMTQVHFENLNSLIDQLDQAKLIRENTNFNIGNKADNKIYAKLFPNLPILNVVKDKQVGYKVLGGMDVKSVYELGQIHEDDLSYVKETYPKTKNLVGKIEGGKLKDFNTEPPSQKFLPYRIKIKFYQ